MHTHVLPKVANDLSGSMITKQTHAATQHLSSTFHDFHDRRLHEAHGGSWSQRLAVFLSSVGGGLAEAPFGACSLAMSSPGEEAKCSWCRSVRFS